MALYQIHTESADVDLTSEVAVLTDTPAAATTCLAYIEFGDGSKDLDGSGGLFDIAVTIGGQTLQPSPETISFSTATRSCIWIGPFPVPASSEVIVTAHSPNAADSDVTVTSSLYDTTYYLTSDLAAIDTVVDAILEDTGTTIPGTITTIDNEIAVIDGIVDTILLDTAELQTDWANGGRLDLLLDAVKAKTDNLPSSVPKAVALPDFAFVMYSSTDHVTPSTGLSVSGYISKDGGAFAALGGTISAIASGVYQVDEISAVETDADIIVLRFTAAGADDVVIVIKTDS